MNEKANASGLRSGMGILMGRAFREGVEKHRKISMRVKPKQWRPLDDLKGLTSRTQQTKLTMGPLQEVPAMVRIEEEHWVFERISQEVLTQLTHRLVIHKPSGTTAIGGTLDLQTAVEVARRMAQKNGEVVMIEPL
ncbi:MAG TPA: hypothetical protein D7H86_03700 [Candidatus Poseidoniales archaeon]|nr:MAG TPA: hypothetical protein D7H86_03700 [Candidatus Poseidoniales archaeon]